MRNRTLKTSKKIKAIKKGGALLGIIREKLADSIRPGITSFELNIQAEKLIANTGGEASFKQVPGYGYATCININNGIVHGIPDKKIIKEGDIVSIDIGLLYQEYHTDCATTVIAGKASWEDNEFLEAGKKALKRAISQAVIGNKVENISRSLQNTIESKGYTCAKSLTGHGIGKKLHEDPPIPCFVNENNKHSPKLYIGQTIAIEVIYSQGSDELKLESDGWTLTTADGSKSALFEDTILITKDKPVVLTEKKQSLDKKL